MATSSVIEIKHSKKFQYAIADDDGGWWPATEKQAKAINQFLFGTTMSLSDEEKKRIYKDPELRSLRYPIGDGDYFNVRNKTNGQKYQGQNGSHRGGEWVEIQDRTRPYLWRSVGKKFITPSFTTENVTTPQHKKPRTK
jgi:hypothetical protein